MPNKWGIIDYTYQSYQCMIMCIRIYNTLMLCFTYKKKCCVWFAKMRKEWNRFLLRKRMMERINPNKIDYISFSFQQTKQAIRVWPLIMCALMNNATS